MFTLREAGGAWVLSPRDAPHEVTGIGGRFVRAHRNLLEIFPQFAAALFVVHAADAVGSLAAIGAWTFVTARALYVPAYAFGPPGLRPLFWQAAWVGILIILADLLW